MKTDKNNLLLHSSYTTVDKKAVLI